MRFDFVWLLILGLSFPFNESLAIPPPDLILSGLQSVMQVFGVAVAFVVSIFFLLKDNVKLGWQLHRKKMVLGSILFLLALLAMVGWSFDIIRL